jgi:hypothetical protein
VNVDPYWTLAEGIEAFPDLAELPGPWEPGIVGVAVARPHQTGWFLSGHVRANLTPDERNDFTEFAKVRAFVLLRHGPQAGLWEPAANDDDWLARMPADEWRVADHVPDGLPAHWR